MLHPADDGNKPETAVQGQFLAPHDLISHMHVNQCPILRRRSLEKADLNMYSSNCVFLVPWKVESSDHMGKDTHVSLSTSQQSIVRPEHLG